MGGQAIIKLIFIVYLSGNSHVWCLLTTVGNAIHPYVSEQPAYLPR